MTTPAMHPRVTSFASIIDQSTIDQANALAALPIVHPHIALMPDAHAGKGSSVGTVIPTRDAVIPAAVGVDIGCGMIAVETDYTRADIVHCLHRLADLREAIEDAIPLSPGNYNTNLARFPFTQGRIDALEAIADTTGVDLTHSPKWREQLGSLGGGNHFIELCVDERGRIWLFLHSGSRGVGNKIAQRHIKAAKVQRFVAGDTLTDPDHAWLDQGTPEFDSYLNELTWAQRFALLNRDEMMDRFIQVFAQWLGAAPSAVERRRINAHHNYTTPEAINGDTVWLTRKGAISAEEGELGLIPGSMGTSSYVVRGKGNPLALYSAPHGAGRKFSRNQAKKQFTEQDLADRMRGIEYRHGPEWIDEIPDAYKDIRTVIQDAEPLVDVVHELHQLLNVKGT